MSAFWNSNLGYFQVFIVICPASVFLYCWIQVCWIFLSQQSSMSVILKPSLSLWHSWKWAVSELFFWIRRGGGERCAGGKEWVPFSLICTACRDAHLAVSVLWWIPSKVAFLYKFNKSNTGSCAKWVYRTLIYVTCRLRGLVIIIKLLFLNISAYLQNMFQSCIYLHVGYRYMSHFYYIKKKTEPYFRF